MRKLILLDAPLRRMAFWTAEDLTDDGPEGEDTPGHTIDIDGPEGEGADEGQ